MELRVPSYEAQEPFPRHVLSRNKYLYGMECHSLIRADGDVPLDQESIAYCRLQHARDDEDKLPLSLVSSVLLVRLLNGITTLLRCDNVAHS